MKIAIIGSHGVGKSTLAKELSKILKFPILPDTAREALLKGFAVNEATPPENQLWILSKQMEYERELKDNFIADKTLFDNIVYARQIFTDQNFLTVIENIVQKIASYDLYIYLPIEIPLVDDGRSMDPVFQQKIDAEYLKLMGEFGISYYQVRGSIKERLKMSMQIISLFRKKSPVNLRQKTLAF